MDALEDPQVVLVLVVVPIAKDPNPCGQIVEDKAAEIRDERLNTHANAALAPTVRGAQIYTLSLDEYKSRGQAISRGTPVPIVGGGSRSIDVVPILTGAGIVGLAHALVGARAGLRVGVLPILFRVSRGEKGLVKSMEELRLMARRLIEEEEVNVIILSDRGVNKDFAPIPALMAVADRLMVLNFGEKIAEGTPAEIARHQAVLDVYLQIAREPGPARG